MLHEPRAKMGQVVATVGMGRRATPMTMKLAGVVQLLLSRALETCRGRRCSGVGGPWWGVLHAHARRG